jgi:ribose 5-phosphate isomerase A
MSNAANELRAVAERALSYVPEGGIIGLGTGKAATEFIHALGERVRAGLKIRGVPTSEASAALARQLGIPLTTLEEVEGLDVDVDGADEVDPNCQLVKGYGGALLREKIVAAASKKFIVVVGPEKIVTALGTRGKLPVEIVPFGLGLCSRRLTALGLTPEVRMKDGKQFITDNGNLILDCGMKPLADPEGLELSIRAIPGVVGTGLFLGMATAVLVQRGSSVEVLEPKKRG